MVTRRGFLGALLAAPAIVHSENLMKIFVPKKELVLPLGYSDELARLISLTKVRTTNAAVERLIQLRPIERIIVGKSRFASEWPAGYMHSESKRHGDEYHHRFVLPEHYKPPPLDLEYGGPIGYCPENYNEVLR